MADMIDYRELAAILFFTTVAGAPVLAVACGIIFFK